MTTLKRVIWKHEVPVESPEFRLTLPQRAFVLTVQEQAPGRVFLWEAHEPEDEHVLESRTFRWALTGLPAEVQPIRYIGTVQLNEGTYVLHFFEVEDP